MFAVSTPHEESIYPSGRHHNVNLLHTKLLLVAIVILQVLAFICVSHNASSLGLVELTGNGFLVGDYTLVNALYENNKNMTQSMDSGENDKNMTQTVVSSEIVDEGNRISDLNFFNQIKVKNNTFSHNINDLKGITNSSLLDNDNAACIPNIVHWVWFYPEGQEFEFLHCISALSALYIQKPDRIYIWNNNLPSGEWWKFVLRVSDYLNIPIISKQFNPPYKISGTWIEFPAHKTDIVRLSVLHDYGGIYMDFDVVILKSLKPLMCKHEMVLGSESEVKLNNGFILAKPGARFIKLWINYYLVQYDSFSWDYNSVCVPFNLWRLHRDWLHVEQRTFHYPSWREGEIQYIFQSYMYYDWSKNYVMHTWYRYYNRVLNPERIKTRKSTLGQICRFIWYGSPELIMTN